MTYQEESKIVLVTGAGHAEGIGFELCRQFATQGMTVLRTARELAKARSHADILVAEGFDVRPLALDVASDQSVKRAAAAVEAEFGRLDVLVNNAAGSGPFGEKPSDADVETAHRVMEVNLLGAWRMCQAFLPLTTKPFIPHCL
jgi:NAD(P)-dependent dehydrogenase (short-subunit alcohol dehydrogenase family)